MARKVACIIEEDRFDEVERKMKDGLVDVIRWGTEGTVGAAKKNVIRYDAILTGDMMRSIHGVYSKKGTASEVVVGVEYASYVHDGTRYVRARPFLADAVNEMEPQIEDRLGELFGEK